MVLQYAPAKARFLGNAIGVCRMETVAIDAIDGGEDDFLAGGFALIWFWVFSLS